MVPVVTPDTGTSMVTVSPEMMSLLLGTRVTPTGTVTATCVLPSYTRSTAATLLRPLTVMGLRVMLPVVLPEVVAKV